MPSFTNFGFYLNFLLSKLWKLILITLLNPSQSKVKFYPNSNYIELLFNMLTFFTLNQSKIESNPIHVIDCVSICLWYLPLTKRIHWIFIILHLNVPNFRVLFFFKWKRTCIFIIKTKFISSLGLMARHQFAANLFQESELKIWTIQALAVNFCWFKRSS